MTHPSNCACYPCRGRRARETFLLRQSQAAVADAARVYSNAEKQKVRAVLLRAVEHLGGPFLDLWGAGESTRQVRAAFPDVAVTSADNDRRFRLALEHDAAEYGYTAHTGDVTRVDGSYKIVNLDTCSEVFAAGELAAAMVPKLAPGGLMFVTVMGSGRSVGQLGRRDVAFAAALAAETDLRVVCVFRYRTLTGLPAYMIGLTQQTQAGQWALRPAAIRRQVEADGSYINPDWYWLSPRRDPERVRLRHRDWTRIRVGRVPVERPCAREKCANIITVDQRSDQKFCSLVCIRVGITARSNAGRQARRIAARPDRPCARGRCAAMIPAAEDARKLYCSVECRTIASMARNSLRPSRSRAGRTVEYLRRRDRSMHPMSAT